MIRELTVLALLFVFIQADVFRHRRFENIVNERKPGSPNLRTRSSGEYCETTRDCPRGTCDTVLQECIDDPNFTKRVAGLMKRCEFDFECGGGSCKAGYCY
ncbi:uncharacterized protein LOC142348525 [Convolutriloba macropyga]|uniref:uncharacterized protein LOC142348525 n=1 Tax=Convolutriloba macropyga TaxID=536237 RepID=UPI003F52573F